LRLPFLIDPWEVNVPLWSSRYNSDTRRQSNRRGGGDLGLASVPSRECLAAVRLLEDILVEVVDRLPHSDLGQLSRVVRDGSAASKALKHDCERSSSAVSVPKCESAASCEFPGSIPGHEDSQRCSSAALERLVIRERLDYVFNRCLSGVSAQVYQYRR
jgi:hypothetical protein